MAITKLFTTTNQHGIRFAVRVIYQGDAYGREDCKTHDKIAPLVEFYNGVEYKTSPPGHFISRYYRSTLTGHSQFGRRNRCDGLCLYGGDRRFDVPGALMEEIIRWIESQDIPETAIPSD